MPWANLCCTGNCSCRSPPQDIISARMNMARNPDRTQQQRFGFGLNVDDLSKLMANGTIPVANGRANRIYEIPWVTVGKLATRSHRDLSTTASCDHRVWRKWISRLFGSDLRMRMGLRRSLHGEPLRNFVPVPHGSIDPT